MEDRYQILGKIGQGGLGAVYRAFDARMNREVAIKRISNVSDDPALQEESTQQLIKEAGALASLQHPNIVTVYDVGADEDGPYVVMELINGKTLDELIEHAPLTWPDFKEMALQTQEALIAAQELNIIHGDLKPSNLMLTWLPSGKFQMKIVDFGLATIAQSQSKHDLESIETVFGSIFFMPPEQFLRSPLDMRSDMYSIGCVYYQTLTGRYPFDGKLGNEVMDAHLNHHVTPIQDVRAGIPLWACDWIMWHMNRFPEDRPESAREGLSLLLQNDRIPNAAMSLGVPKKVVVSPVGQPGPPRPRMRNSGPVSPQGAAPARKETSAQVPGVNKVQTSAVSTVAVETQPVPQPLVPPEGLKRSVHAEVEEALQQHDLTVQATQQLQLTHTQQITQAAAVSKTPVKMAKNTKIALSVVVGVLVLILVIVAIKIGGTKHQSGVVENILAAAEKGGDVEVDAKSLQLIFQSLVRNETDTNVDRTCAALIHAKAKDTSDVDMSVVDFVTQSPKVSVKTREALIGKVLRARKNPVIMPAMLDLAYSTSDPALIVAALQSVREMMKEEHFTKLLELLSATDNKLIRDAAEANMTEILMKTKKSDVLTKQLTSAKEGSFKPDLQAALKRLISIGKTLGSKK